MRDFICSHEVIDLRRLVLNSLHLLLLRNVTNAALFFYQSPIVATTSVPASAFLCSFRLNSDFILGLLLSCLLVAYVLFITFDLGEVE